MELRHLRYFLVVVEEGSLGRAAARLHVAQPSLGRQMTDLEHQLGQRLFERDARGMRITPAGRALVAHAREIVRLAEASREVVASGVPRERVSLGVGPTVDADWLLELVEASKGQSPHVTLRIDEMLSGELIGAVASGDLDVAVSSRRPGDQVQSVLLWAEPFGLAIGPSGRLKGFEEVAARDLDHARVLAFAREQTPPEHNEAIREIETESPRVRWEFARFSTSAHANAMAVDADAILCGEAAARRLPPTWRWLPLGRLRTEMHAWLTWRPGSGDRVLQLVELIKGIAPPSGARLAEPRAPSM